MWPIVKIILADDSRMRPKDSLADCADVLAAIAVPERLQAILLLRTGPQMVSATARAVGIPIANMSYHLSVLRDLGLVCRRRNGRFILYSLAPGVLRSASRGNVEFEFGCCRLEVPIEQAPGTAAGRLGQTALHSI